MLLKAGAAVDGSNERHFHNVALHSSPNKGSLACATTLIEADADLNLRNELERRRCTNLVSGAPTSWRDDAAPRRVHRCDAGARFVAQWCRPPRKQPRLPHAAPAGPHAPRARARAPISSAAYLVVLCADEPWSPHNHALFPHASRAHAVALVRLGFLEPRVRAANAGRGGESLGHSFMLASCGRVVRRHHAMPIVIIDRASAGERESPRAGVTAGTGDGRRGRGRAARRGEHGGESCVLRYAGVQAMTAMTGS